MKEKVTICLNTAQPEVLGRQMKLLAPLIETGQFDYNNRIDRNADYYDSYSQLINENVAYANNEYVIFMNDDILPSPQDVWFLLGKLDEGFALASLASIGFIALSKEVFRVVGWWDQRFLGGGYEDDDFILKVRCHELGYYESHSAKQDRSVRGKNKKPPWLHYPLEYTGPHFAAKWSTECSVIEQRIADEVYPEYDGRLGPRRHDISSRWKAWDESVVWVDFDDKRINEGLIGPSRTYWFRQRDGLEVKQVRSPQITPRAWKQCLTNA